MLEYLNVPFLVYYCYNNDLSVVHSSTAKLFGYDALLFFVINDIQWKIE